MPIDIVMDNSITTIRLIYHPTWNWDEFYKTNNTVYSALGRSGQTLNLIIDLSRTIALPDNMLYHLSRTTYFNHPNLATITVMGATLFQEAVYRMLINVSPHLTTPIQFAKMRGKEVQVV